MRALIGSIVVALALVWTSVPAAADTREEARRAFSAGQVADKAKDWRQAIKHYLHAFELVPHHFAAYNIGTDYEQLGELREAAIWFDRYLELAPQSPDRDKVMRLIVDLKLRPAKLTVRSSPSGANVIIDGQKVGVTPYERPIRGGGRRVAVELRGVRDERDVELQYAEPKLVEFTLSGVPAEPRTVTSTAPGASSEAPTSTETVLEVRGQPQGARVAIDGEVIGTLPTRVVVTPGAHRIDVVQAGYNRHEALVTAAENEVTPVDVTLEVEGTGSAVPKFYYVIGGAGGTDARGLGQTYLVEIGLRALTYDLTSRFGKSFGQTSIEVLGRVGWGKGRVVPFLAVGYSYLGSGLSYELGAGVRVDLTKRGGYGASLVAEIDMRTYAITTTDPVTMVDTTENGIALPILVSLQVMLNK